MVADGQTAKIAVRNGRLTIEDGVPGHRRNRQVPKVPREVTRLVILARQGYITLEALRWLLATRIQVTHIAEDITMTSGGEEGDCRVLRQQVTSRRNSAVALYLIQRKIEQQAAVIEEYFQPNRTSRRLRDLAASLPGKDLDTMRGIEGQAAGLYWDNWKGLVGVWWEPSDLIIVPPHWRTFPGRPSLRHDWDTNRNATDPVNAMLNYTYKILETETLTACRTSGLHPDIGVIHTDRKTDRHAFVLDLMEPARPFCDRLVYQVIAGYQPPRYFSRRWCHEEKDGVCTLDPPLTHQLAGLAPQIGAHVRGYAEAVRKLYQVKDIR